MVLDEGYIKYQSDWIKSAPLPNDSIKELNSWRAKFYQLGLLGAYANGIGFGNISQRWNTKDGLFAISGSTTGNIEVLDETHYTLVTEVQVDRNFLKCSGPIIASSESMSHAAIYEQCPKINAAIHVHHEAMWQYYLDKVPSTAEDIPYGTPEMAYAIANLLTEKTTQELGFFVMAGHREGMFAFGESLKEAGEKLLHFYHKFQENATL